MDSCYINECTTVTIVDEYFYAIGESNRQFRLNTGKTISINNLFVLFVFLLVFV